MKRAAGSVLGAAGLIAVLTLISRIAGLVRKLAQSWAMSDGSVATAYDTANTVPNVLFEVAAGGALAGAVVPLISRFIARKMEREASQTASALLTWVLAIGLPLAGTIALVAHPVVSSLFGADTDPQIIDLAATLLRMFALQIPLYGLSVVFTGVLQAYKRFLLPALSPLLSSIVVIGVFTYFAITAGPHVGPNELSHIAIYWLGWGTTIGVVAFSLPQAIPVFTLVKIRPTFHFPLGVGSQTMRLAGAGLAALVVQQIAIIAIMYSANNLGGIGAYTTFNYAYAIFMVPYAVLAVPIATAVFPRISEAAELNSADLQSIVSRSTKLVLAMGITAVALLVVLAKPAQLVLEVGRSIAGLDIAMISMAVGLVGFSMLYHGARVLYALDSGKRVIQVNSLAWGITIGILIVANYVVPHGRVYALIAIGAAMSVGMSCGAFSSMRAIRKEVGIRAVEGMVKPLGIVTGSLLLGGTGSWFVVRLILDFVGYSVLGGFISAIVGGILIVIVAGVALYVPDRNIVKDIRR